MARTLVVQCLGVGIVVGLFGCAASNTAERTAEWQPRFEEQAKAQARLDLRLEEVTRNVLVLRERLDALEASVANLEDSRQTPAQPPLRVVKLEPPVVETAPAAPSVDGTAAADLYRKSYTAYGEGRFGQAILDFEDFLRAYPDHEYADNAQYWIGESYYSQGEFNQAVVEFNRVLERYPHDAKVPDALLKIGLSYQQLGNADRAKVFWQRLIAEHPGSEAAVEARKRLSAAD